MRWFRAFWRRWIADRQPAPKAPTPPKASPPVVVRPPTVVEPLSLVAFARQSEPAGSSPRDIVRAVAAGIADKVDDLGWIGIVDATGRLDISRANRVWLIMLHGIAAADAAYVDKALVCIKGVLAWQGADGSFPTQDFGEARKHHSFHHKMITLAEVAQSLHAVRGSPFYVGARMALIDSLTSQVALSARWCAASDDMARFFRDAAGAANQFLSPILFLHAAGLLTADEPLQSAARAKMEWVFANMVTADGVFLEKDGFDTVYHLFSLKMLACYVMLLPQGLWRETCLGRLRLGLRRWVQCIDPATGLIDTSASSRTTERPTRTPGKIDTWDSAATGFQLYLGNYVAGSGGYAVPIDVIAARQIAAGQTFLHQTEA